MLGKPTPAYLVLLAAVASLSGCGSNASDILTQYAQAAAQTAVDQWLTSLANQINGTPIEPDDDDPTPGDGDTGNGETDQPVGNPVQGEELYTANNCGGCHCPDASGGCALSAPAIIAASVDNVASILDVASGHPFRPELTETDVGDLAAYLATLIPG